MILVIDNYDSFTYNLVQLLAVLGAEVEVLRNDVTSARQMLDLGPSGIVLSPGPGRPEGAGVCLELLAQRPPMPLLGVCLGHQALGVAFGARLERARRPMHGKTSSVRHSNQGLFQGLPNPFEATRYHSLEVPVGSLPRELEPLAWCDETTLMGMRHSWLPYWGLQFHPESVLTEGGEQLVRNFLETCGQASDE